MTNNINYTQELEKVIGIFSYRGCEVKNQGKGYIVLGFLCPTLEVVDQIIDASLQSLSKSILI